MLNNRKIAVVLPAYNAAKTVQRTVDEIPLDIVDDIILTDDASSDDTAVLAQRLGLHVIRHDENRGYGANQKTCYEAALARGADIIVMLHPDYQYTPLLVTAMASMIAYDQYDCVLASRILGKRRAAGRHAPLQVHFESCPDADTKSANRTEAIGYHTGYRAWSREVIERLPLLCCSDDFVFDNQIIVQAIHFGFRIGEISCPTKYFDDASSINFKRSVIYGIGVINTALQFLLKKWRLANPSFLDDRTECRLGHPVRT